MDNQKLIAKTSLINLPFFKVIVGFICQILKKSLALQQEEDW